MTKPDSLRGQSATLFQGTSSHRLGTDTRIVLVLPSDSDPLRSISFVYRVFFHLFSYERFLCFASTHLC